MDILSLPTMLMIAWLLPLTSFAIISIGYSVPQFFGVRASYASSKLAGYIASGAIIAGFVLSFIALFGIWLHENPLSEVAHGDAAEHAAEDHADSADGEAVHEVAAVEETADAAHADDSHAADHTNPPPPNLAGDWYELAVFGDMKLTIGYYIDTLTVLMFVMVTLIASCVHIYSMGYMHDELHDFTDPEVTLSDGEKLTRRGRYHRFFQYLSLFSFSMLGVVIAGNLAMTFVFWELVGICSYFLIGFYIERHSASSAGNKAFIVNRVGDFGMLIGLMILWTSLGTFSYGDVMNEDGTVEPGMFSLLRTEAHDYHLEPPDGMVALAARDEIGAAVLAAGAGADVDAVIAAEVAELREDESRHVGGWLLLIAGIGVFCGCVGKSAQFPLHTWLPDAMEGPTPVSALVHSATMVAAGVFLVGRCYPLFSPETLLVIAAIGCITLFIAATIAITAVDIKRVLAYSTISQLGYMMLALGLGGFVAGLFHLITHAFFKSLLFLCSGSVIHAVHTNDMREMGGLRKKMPITAYTMLVGCLAIAGVGVPFLAGFSGFHSKDRIVEQALSHWHANWDSTFGWVFFVVPIVGAAITAFYMFRLWYMTFAGEPRDHHRYDHAHESPRTMTVPLLILAFFAISIGWTLPFSDISIVNLLEHARPVGTLATDTGELMPNLAVPSEHLAHEPEMFRSIKLPAGLSAITAAALGILLATVIYLWRMADPAKISQALRPLYSLCWHKWWFDELYNFVFVRPTMAISNLAAGFDKRVIDSIIHSCAWICRQLSAVVDVVGDKIFINRSVDTLAYKTWDAGLSLRAIQTGRLRQYVMFIVIGTVVMFLCASVWKFAFAG